MAGLIDRDMAALDARWIDSELAQQACGNEPA
jgi:hypothetical protein